MLPVDHGSIAPITLRHPHLLQLLYWQKSISSTDPATTDWTTRWGIRSAIQELEQEKVVSTTLN